MSKECFNSALNYLDYDLVEEFVTERESSTKRMKRRKVIRSVSSIAACLTVLTILPLFVFFVVLGGFKAGSAAPGEPGNMSGENIVPLPPEDSSPSNYPMGSFTFIFNGKSYIVDFNNEEDAAAEEIVLGEYLGEITLSDEYGNISTCRIYASLDEESKSIIIIETLNGVYHLAQEIIE